MNGTDRREAIVDAMLRLLADRPFEEVTVRAIADGAGVSLVGLQGEFPTRGHVIAAFSRRIDRDVLGADTSDMADEAPRERLFDVLMSRLDALRPYRAGVHALLRAARRDPGLALGLNAIAMESMGWMLAAARISAPGWRGRLAVQGLAVAFARVLRVFVTEDDAGMPRTMAALDRELKEAERNHGRFARIFGRAVRQDGPAHADHDETFPAAHTEEMPAEPRPDHPAERTPLETAAELQGAAEVEPAPDQEPPRDVSAPDARPEGTGQPAVPRKPKQMRRRKAD